MGQTTALLIHGMIDKDDRAFFELVLNFREAKSVTEQKAILDAIRRMSSGHPFCDNVYSRHLLCYESGFVTMTHFAIATDNFVNHTQVMEDFLDMVGSRLHKVSGLTYDDINDPTRHLIKEDGRIRSEVMCDDYQERYEIVNRYCENVGLFFAP